MRDFSVYLSLTTLVLFFGYIGYQEWGKGSGGQGISDEADAFNDVGGELLLGPVPSLPLPDSIDFAGEPVPLDIPDVRERLDKEILVNAYLHSNTILLIKRANRWLPQIEKILERHKVPSDFKYLPLIESYLLNAISEAEAVGFWQILKGSGREYGLEITHEVDERYDPLKATEAACRYLLDAHAKFGNWTLAAASYNRGMNGLQRAIENQHENNFYHLYLNDQTSRYIFRVLAIKEIIEHPGQYGFAIKPNQLYEEEKLHYVEVGETINDLVAFARAQGINYKLLKRHNPWLQEDKLTVKKGKIYRISIPLKP